MAEAIALAMSIFALLDRLTVLTTQFGCSLRDAPDDILRLRESLGGVSAVFGTLFGGDDPRQGINGSRLECLRAPLYGLNRDLEELTSGIEILEVKRSKRIRWALGEEDRFSKAVQRLEAYKTLFALAIAADERLLAQNSRETVELLRTDLTDFRNEERASQEAVIAAVRSIERSQRLSLNSTESLRNQKLEERNERLRRGEERKFEKLVTNTFNWLGYTDCKTDHDSARESCMPDTGTWFTKGTAFAAWKLGNQPYLWLNGIPGAGKSVLISSTIEALRETVVDKECCIAYHYFTFTDAQKARADRMIESIVSQVAHQGWRCKNRRVIDVLCQMYRKYERTSQRPSASELSRALFTLINLFEQSVYIVVDALDECTESKRLLDFLETLHSWKCPNLRLLVSSRAEAHITTCLSSLEFGNIPLQTRLVDYDIALYVDERLSRGKWRYYDRALNHCIRERLVGGAKGMFRLVKCQMDILENCRNVAAIEKALETLPAELDAVYSRMLRDIKKSDWAAAGRILTWLIACKEPLPTEALTCVPMICLDTQTVDAGRMLLSSQEILEMCGSLLKPVNNGWGEEVIVLAHCSIEEYLIRMPLQGSDLSPYFAISKGKADSDMCAMGILILQWADSRNVPDPTEESSGQSATARLLKYCARYWWQHASSEEVQRERMPLIRSLLRDRRGYRSWLRGTVRGWERTNMLGCEYQHCSFMNGRTLTADCCCDATELYLASFLGLRAVVARILDDGPTMAATQRDRSAALGAAVEQGHADVVALLLSHRADADFHVQVNPTIAGWWILRQLQISDVAGRSPSYYGGSLLLLAVEKGFVDIAGLLVRHGADVNASFRGRSVLEWAAHRGCEESVRLLLRNGARIDASPTAPLQRSTHATATATAAIADPHATRSFSFHGCSFQSILHCTVSHCHRLQVEIVKLLHDCASDLLRAALREALVCSDFDLVLALLHGRGCVSNEKLVHSVLHAK